MIAQPAPKSEVLARRDQRCEDLAVSLDETKASLDAAIAALGIGDDDE